MPSPEDSLAIIAESYKGIHESTQVIAQATMRMEATQQGLAATNQYIAQTQRLGLKIQAFCCVMIGLGLLFTGYVVWQHVTYSQEHAALTQALLETLQRLPKP